MAEQVAQQVFRLPRLAYGVVLFLVFGVTALAPGARTGLTGDDGSALNSPLWWLVYLIPVGAACYIARTATIVDAGGITVRALFGSRHLPWSEVTGLAVQDNGIYAVTADGSVRLPCVKVVDLHDLSRASGEHLPEIERARLKFAPKPRRR